MRFCACSRNGETCRSEIAARIECGVERHLAAVDAIASVSDLKVEPIRRRRWWSIDCGSDRGLARMLDRIGPDTSATNLAV